MVRMAGAMIQLQCGMRNANCGISREGRARVDASIYIPNSEFRISH